MARLHRVPCAAILMDRRLIELREALRRVPGIAQPELLDLLTILAALSNLAGRYRSQLG